MRRFTVLFLLALVTSLSAQQAITLGTYCGDDRSSTREINKALVALQKRDYPSAQLYIGTALRINENDQHAHYLRGELALKQKNVAIAEASWKRLIRDCPGYKPDLSFYVGAMALSDGRPEEAKHYLEQWLLRDDRNFDYDIEAEEMLAEINVKTHLLANPVPFDPRPARDINTNWDEYLAAMTPDGSTMYFTRRSKKRDKYDGPAAPVRSVEEFSVSYVKGQRAGMPYLEEGVALEAPFNSQYNEGGPTLTADNRLMVFTICELEGKTGKQNCDLYYTSFEYGVWNGIRPLPDHINSPDSWESQPSISPNGDVLYFTSDREGGYGGLDLYYTQRLPGGMWGPVHNLGATINTKKNEKSPFIHPDSESLYFASDGHPGMGGYDLFKSIEREGAWDKPLNLGYPINTEKDEIGLLVTLDGTKAYFASNKINRANGWDIYFFDLYEAVRPEEVVLVKGTVNRDQFASDEAPKIILKNNVTGVEQTLEVSNDDRSFTAVIKKEEANEVLVKIEAKKAAFSAAPIRLKSQSEGAPTVELTLEHRDLERGGAYPIPHILFETASDLLDAQSVLLLQEFADFLAKNGNLRVEIQGHTDNVGDGNANLDLSRRRARSVARQLEIFGISSSRLSHQGYGETRPIASNDTEQGRAQNRRTVFVVTSL
ncbi:MAG: hypothetical protein RL754_337 [Bacteroidota bacterium]